MKKSKRDGIVKAIHTARGRAIELQNQLADDFRGRIFVAPNEWYVPEQYKGRWCIFNDITLENGYVGASLTVCHKTPLKRYANKLKSKKATFITPVEYLVEAEE